MRFIRPHKLLAGFWVDGPPPGVPEMRQFGEHWVPNSFSTGMHKHWFWDIHYQVEGTTRWKHPGGVSEMKTGEACLVAPGVEHGSLPHAGEAQHFYFIEIDLRPWLQIDERLLRSPEFRILSGSSNLHQLFKLIIQEGSQAKQHQAESLKHLLGLVAIEVQRLVIDTNKPASGREGMPIHAPPAVLRARDIIERHPERDWRLDELAYIIELSPNHLTALFRKHFAVTPMRYVHQQRISRSKELLLKADFSISAVALMLGYSSSQHFSARFKTETGTTPGRYIKANKDGRK